MTALSDALEAAQTRALGALQKAYVADAIGAELFTAAAESCGIKGAVDMAQLLASLDVLREWGGPLPESPPAQPKPEPATQPQLDGILRRCKDKQLAPPDQPLTKAQASEIISTMDAGSYDPDKWRTPF